MPETINSLRKAHAFLNRLAGVGFTDERNITACGFCLQLLKQDDAEAAAQAVRLILTQEYGMEAEVTVRTGSNRLVTTDFGSGQTTPNGFVTVYQIAVFALADAVSFDGQLVLEPKRGKPHGTLSAIGDFKPFFPPPDRRPLHERVTIHG